MNKFQLSFIEALSVHYRMTINTNMSEDELNDILDNLDCDTADDIPYCLENRYGIAVEEVVAGDPEVDEIECDDLYEVK